jgi:outer membrane receptor protein involved in Fe transport
MELEVEGRPFDSWTLTGSFSHLDANERPSGEELLRIPKNTVGFSLRYEPDSRWEGRLEGLLVSSREESTGANARDKTKGYGKWDLYAQYRFAPWGKGYVRIDNLTDENYSEVLGFPASGTVAYAGVTIER